LCLNAHEERTFFHSDDKLTSETIFSVHSRNNCRLGFQFGFHRGELRRPPRVPAIFLAYPGLSTGLFRVIP
jgi:hypothetical protein